MCENKRDGKRELGTIVDVWSGKEDHGILTCSIGIDFRGSHQGFGNLCLDKKILPDFMEGVCETFGVKTLNELVGKQCYALRCFSHWNEPIEGLETLDGKRFTLFSWRKKHFPNSKSPYEERISSLKNRIASDMRRIDDAYKELRKIHTEYTDWG